MLKKLKKKHLTQAVILGLLLAVPLGAQATDYTDTLTGTNEIYFDIRTYDDDSKTFSYAFDGDDRIKVDKSASKEDNIAVGGSQTGYNYNLGNLRYIDASTEHSYGQGNTNIASAIHVWVKDNTPGSLTLGDADIKSSSDAWYVTGIYLGPMGSMDDASPYYANMGKVHITAESNFSGEYGVDGNTGRAYGISSNGGASITLGNGSEIEAKGTGNWKIQAWGVSA